MSKKRDTSTTVEHKPAEPTEPAEPVESPKIETTIVTGRTLLDLDFYIDQQKRLGYTAKGVKCYDFDNMFWMRTMERLEGFRVDLDVNELVPKWIEFDINAATQSAIHAAVSQQKTIGCEQVGPPVFDSQKNWYTVRMRKSPQER